MRMRKRVWIPLVGGVVVAGASVAACRALHPTDRVLTPPISDAPPTASARPAPPGGVAAAATRPVPPTEVRPTAEVSAPPAGPPPSPAPPPTPPAPSLGFEAFVQGLRVDVRDGRDSDLKPFADLLGAIVTHAKQSSRDVAVVPAREVEDELDRRHRGKLSWAMVAHYVEPGATPDAMARVYRSYDKYPEWTGQTNQRLVERSPAGALVEVHLNEKIVIWTVSASWRFRARHVQRASAHLNLCSREDWSGTKGMIDTRCVLLAFPEGGGTRVVEASISVMDAPWPVVSGKEMGRNASIDDLTKRMTALRGRWREPAR